MDAILILILKCLLLGVIWAALLIPVIFNRGGWLKYIITVLIAAIACCLPARPRGNHKQNDPDCSDHPCRLMDCFHGCV